MTGQLHGLRQVLAVRPRGPSGCQSAQPSEKVQIAATTVPKFSAGSTLKAASRTAARPVAGTGRRRGPESRQASASAGRTRGGPRERPSPVCAGRRRVACAGGTECRAWPSRRRPSPTGSPSAVERKRSPARRRARPATRPDAGRARGDVSRPRRGAEGCARFCCGIVDAVAPYTSARQAAARLLRGARVGRVGRLRGGLRLRAPAGLLVIADAQARRHRLDRPGLRGGLPRAGEGRARSPTR